MTGRNRRRAGMKARIGVAAAVLIGGGAAGVAAVAANNPGPASTTATEAGYIMGFRHHIREDAALGSAMNTWGRSHQASLNTLAQMVPMRTFSQVWGGWRHRTMYAAQRGVVVLANRNFLLVKSANGQYHLWWLTRTTAFTNVTANAAGMTAMTGNNPAAVQAVVNRNTATAQTVMAGSPTAVAQMNTPVAKPTVVTIVSGNQIITITISTAAQQGMTATPTATATVSPTFTPTATAMTTQPVTTAMHGVARGDLVLITGVRVHGRLLAKLVLFAAPATVTPTPSVTASGALIPSATVSVAAVPTRTARVNATSMPTFSGNKS